MKFSRVAASVLALASFAAATGAAQGEAWAAPLDLARRQDAGSGNNGNSDGNNNNDQVTSAAPASSSSTSPDSKVTDPPSSATSASSDNKSNTAATTAAKTDGSKTQASATSRFTNAPIDPQDPPGTGAMITPAVISGMPFYKVDQTVTWVWNYTYLLRNPQAIDILATVPGVVPAPLTLALNESFSPTQTFKWDTGKFNAETPLPIGTYTLIVYDAAATGGPTAIPSAGYLAPWSLFAFGMYTKQASTLDVTAAVQCVTCNAAAGLPRRSVWGLTAWGGLTVGVVYWFTGGW